MCDDDVSHSCSGRSSSAKPGGTRGGDVCFCTADSCSGRAFYCNLSRCSSISHQLLTPLQLLHDGAY
jgi:hypothetical protein